MLLTPSWLNRNSRCSSGCWPIPPHIKGWLVSAPDQPARRDRASRGANLCGAAGLQSSDVKVSETGRNLWALAAKLPRMRWRAASHRLVECCGPRMRGRGRQAKTQSTSVSTWLKPGRGDCPAAPRAKQGDIQTGLLRHSAGWAPTLPPTSSSACSPCGGRKGSLPPNAVTSAE